MRPAISRRPRTENMIAGSVGANAAPSTPAVDHLNPTRYRATSASSAAVTKVPRSPSDTIGAAESRNRRQPTRSPPSNRITASAMEARRSTLRVERCDRLGKRSDATAAASRKSAPGGTRIRSARRVETTAARTAVATIATQPPNCVSSPTAGAYVAGAVAGVEIVSTRRSSLHRIGHTSLRARHRHRRGAVGRRGQGERSSTCSPSTRTSSAATRAARTQATRSSSATRPTRSARSRAGSYEASRA